MLNKSITRLQQAVPGLTGKIPGMTAVTWVKSFHFILAIAFTAVFSSCHKDLDLRPLNSNTSEKQYSTLLGYKQVLAKVYGAYSLASSGGTGVPDVSIAGIGDPATTDFLRAWWNMQELTTDEAICAWNDPILQQFHNMNWSASNIFVNALYSRSIFQVTVANELIRESTDEKISSRGLKSDEAEIRNFRNEARFLRAFQYWVLMDVFANPPFITEADPIGKYIPPQVTRAQLFSYVETELKDLENLLPPAHSNEYGRADQAAAQALLARLYLNAEVYTGTARFTDAITYSAKVINGGYSLKTDYKTLFMSDNHLNNPEVILAIPYDAVNSANYGGTTFLTCSAHGTNVTDNQKYGIPGGGWLGNRSTKNLPLAFGDYSGNADKRALFGPGNLEINDVIVFNDGIGVYKFNNQTSTGTTPPSPNGVLVSIDFPLFRLAEMYLVYAEAVLRGGTGGSNATALAYFNLLRARGYGNNNGNVSGIQLSDIITERSRELYWEGFRRTDLIRFNQFTGNSYLWPWKGGVRTGTGVDDRFRVYPIPASDLLSNPNLTQNPGY